MLKNFFYFCLIAGAGFVLTTNSGTVQAQKVFLKKGTPPVSDLSLIVPDPMPPSALKPKEEPLRKKAGQKINEEYIQNVIYDKTICPKLHDVGDGKITRCYTEPEKVPDPEPECTGVNMVMFFGKCVCRPGYVMDYGKCIPCTEYEVVGGGEEGETDEDPGGGAKVCDMK